MTVLLVVGLSVPSTVSLPEEVEEITNLQTYVFQGPVVWTWFGFLQWEDTGLLTYELFCDSTTRECTGNVWFSGAFGDVECGFNDEYEADGPMALKPEVKVDLCETVGPSIPYPSPAGVGCSGSISVSGSDISGSGGGNGWGTCPP